MATPASALPFMMSQVSTLGQMTQPSEELSDVVPAQRIPYTSDLEDQVVQRILQTLMEEPPKRKWYQNLPFMTPPNFATGRTSEERMYDERQAQAQRAMQGLNALTGRGRLDIAAERNAIARDNLFYRGEGVRQGWTRIGQADERYNRGVQVKVETTDEQGQPMTLTGWQLPEGRGILLNDGQIIHPSAFPKPIRLTPLTGPEGTGMVNPYTGGMDVARVTDPKTGQPFRPMVPPGVQEKIGAGLSLSGMIRSAASKFFTYAAKAPLNKRLLMAGARGTPLIGESLGDIAVGYADPEANDVATSLKAVADTLLRLKSGAQINESEYQRLRSLLPRLASSEEDAANKFGLFEQELMYRLKVNAQMNPTAFTEAALKAVGLSRSAVGLEPEVTPMQSNPYGLSEDEMQYLEP